MICLDDRGEEVALDDGCAYQGILEKLRNMKFRREHANDWFLSLENRNGFLKPYMSQNET